MTDQTKDYPVYTPAEPPVIEADDYEAPEESKIKEALEENYEEAKKLISNPDSLEKTLQSLEKKLEECCPIPKVGEVLSHVPTLISLVRSYARNEYDIIPVSSVIAIVAALVYCVAHFDLIPDFVPGAGLLDDAAVLLFALNLVKADVDEYKEWRKKHSTTTE